MALVDFQEEELVTAIKECTTPNCAACDDIKGELKRRKAQKMAQHEHTLISQKAKGLMALQYMSDPFQVPEYTIYHGEGDPLLAFPFFARPCPARPRHGFVDSRLVKDKAELDNLIEEIKATGEETEIIAMPKIEADWSAIVNLEGVTYGKGHDGATSGNGAVFIPSSAKVSHFQEAFGVNVTDAGINEGENPYMEIVSKSGKVYAVQLRGGPSGTGSDRYVPVPVTVQKVVLAEGDLLQWEKTVEGLVGQPGVVVHHPGGALSSHYAVHCIVQNIPVLCTDKAPKVGELLEPSKGPKKLRKKDYKLIAKTIAAFLRSKRKPSKDILHLAVAGMHAQALWGPEKHLNILRGIAVGAMLPAAASAVYGELRHYYSNGPGLDGLRAESKDAPFKMFYGRNDDEEGIGRDTVYNRVFKESHGTVRKWLPAAIKDFGAYRWRGAFGGQKWEDCAIKTKDMYDAVEKFLATPTENKWVRVVGTWNNLINAVHNGGALLSKHVSYRFMSTVAVCPSFGLVNRTIANVCLNTRAWERIAERAGSDLSSVVRM